MSVGLHLYITNQTVFPFIFFITEKEKRRLKVKLFSEMGVISFPKLSRFIFGCVNVLIRAATNNLINLQIIVSIELSVGL